MSKSKIVSKIVSLFIAGFYIVALYTKSGFVKDFIWVVSVGTYRVVPLVLLPIVGFVLIWFDGSDEADGIVWKFTSWMLFLLPLIALIIYRSCVKSS